MQRAAGTFLSRLPDSWRARIALAAPRLPVARPVTQAESAYDIAHFERFYARPDPWGFAENENERIKYELTLELCGPGPFERVLEIGCGEGIFTQLLAPRCRSLLAMDISSRAVGRANERLSDYPCVTAVAAALPAAYPPGAFDLVVASDILYYWPEADLRTAAQQIAGSITVGGRFVAVHYALPLVALSTGDKVHALLSEVMEIPHVHSDRRDIGAGRAYLIDVWERSEI